MEWLCSLCGCASVSLGTPFEGSSDFFSDWNLDLNYLNFFTLGGEGVEDSGENIAGRPPLFWIFGIRAWIFFEILILGFKSWLSSNPATSMIKLVESDNGDTHP